VIHRDAGEIGAGLEPARAARPIPPGERIHVVGAGGAAAAAACLLAHYVGARASGCDAGGPSQYTPPLQDAGIPLSWAHDPAHVALDGSFYSWIASPSRRRSRRSIPTTPNSWQRAPGASPRPAFSS